LYFLQFLKQAYESGAVSASHVLKFGKGFFDFSLSGLLLQPDYKCT